MADIIANQAYYLSKSGKINELKQKYKEATQIPIDFIDRLEIIYKSIT